MTKIKDEVLDDLKVENLGMSPEGMAIAVADQKHRKTSTGVEFNCFVLDRTDEVDELDNFLTFLQKVKDNIPDNTRFQVMYRTALTHWSTMDIQIKSGKMEFFLLDAANATRHMLSAFMLINKRCPDSVLRYSGGGIQADLMNCSIFSFDHAFRLANIPDLHEQLALTDTKLSPAAYRSFLAEFIRLDDKKAAEKSRPTILDYLSGVNAISNLYPHKDAAELKSQMFAVAANVHLIPVPELPLSFSPLIRNMQDMQRLNTLIAEKFKGAVANKKINRLQNT